MGNPIITLLRRCLPLLCLLAISAGAQEIPLPTGGGAEPAEPEPQPISVESSPESDQAIAGRLRDIYANIGSLEDVRVRVDAGVVTLDGQIPNQAAQREALRLANQVEGVVAVENDLQGLTDLEDRLSFALRQMSERALSVLAFLPLLAVAVAVLALFWLLSALLLRWDALFRRFTRNSFLVDLFKQLTRGVIMLIALLVALEILDATALLGALIGAAGLFGLALGFALRDTVENYVATILLSIRQPFSPNDHIRLDQYEGLVVRLTSRNTILMTFDGNHIRIPNSTVFKSILVNYTRQRQRRFGFQVGVSPDVDLAGARALALDTLARTPGVLETPPPLCLIKELGDSNVTLEVFGWTDQGRYDFLKVRSAAIQYLKEAFDQADYDMPEPAFRLRIQGIDEKALSAPPQESPTTGRRSPSPPDIERGAVLNVERDLELDEAAARESATEEDLLRADAPKE